MPALWQAGMARIGRPTGVIAALALFGWSLASIAATDRQLEADADTRERHDSTTVLVAREHDACQFVGSVALRRSAPDA